MRPLSVIIIGSDITALSTAWHLKNDGIEDIVIISDQRSDISPLDIDQHGFVSGGFIDNFTRFSHTHGIKKTLKFWKFADQSYDVLHDFCKNHQIKFLQNHRIRIISDQMELKECKQAVDEMNSNGVPSSIEKKNYSSGIQIEKKKGAYCDTQTLKSVLTQGLSKPIINKEIESIESNHNGIKAHFKGGSFLQSQLVVLCNHLKSRSLVPQIKEALIPVAEQWITLKTNAVTTDLSLQNGVGTAFSFNHGNIWGCIANKNTIHVGGARYLRKLAGIGFQHPEDNPTVSSHLTKICQNFFAKDLQPIKSTISFLDCRPCDEIPIIGPMFGDDQILISTGYLGQNINFGFFAGLNIARLIKEGIAPELPREFWPTRLRSIEQA